MNQTLKWPADQVKRVDIDRLIPSARNARTHTDAQVAQIASSMREWGWTMPVLVDEKDNVIAGHGRIMAARVLDWHEVPVMTAKGWSEAQKRAYMLADNKLALNASWDDELLAIELADLKEMDFTLDLVGFSEAEQDSILAGWTGDASDVTGAGESVEGTDRRIVLAVAQADGERAYKVIGDALTASGIGHVFRTG
jgi:ParB-like chromosome segregation protein Spo0J